MKAHLILIGLAAGVPTLPATTPNAVEVELANLIRNHAGQRRPAMVYDSILNVTARAKARDLAVRRYFEHVDPDGYGPNKAAQLAGYVLPSFWGTANDTSYIESLAAGGLSAQESLNQWLTSPGHKQHVLGEIPFYAEQTRYGVGYASVPGSPYTRYYVFVSAPPNPLGDNKLEPWSEWIAGYYTPAQITVADVTGDADKDGIPLLSEFLLDQNPNTPDTLPSPVWNPAANRLDWTLPIRRDPGAILFGVESSLTLLPGTWSTSRVTASQNTFSVSGNGRAEFLRLFVRKP